MFIFLDTSFTSSPDLEPQASIFVGGSEICSLDPPRVNKQLEGYKKAKGGKQPMTMLMLHTRFWVDCNPTLILAMF